MMGDKWEIDWNDGIGMWDAQRIMKSFLGLLFSRRGIKQEFLRVFQGQYKDRKKTLCSTVNVCYTRS